MYDIADHLYYAGKCWNEVREYFLMKTTDTDNTYPCLHLLYWVIPRLGKDKSIEKLYMECKEVYTNILNNKEG